MDYNLAKQLKDAGFPQGDSVYPQDITGEIYPKIPTLSELIEACPKEFVEDKSLEIIYSFSLHYCANDWFAGYLYYDSVKKHISGKTPEEAVAKLWLELNKK